MKLHKDRLAPIARILDDFGIYLGLEFVGPETSRRGKAYSFIHNLDTLNELLDAIGTKNAGYMLDAWHWYTARQTFDDFKKIKGSERIAMVHIADAPKGLAIEEQDDHVRELPGATGVINFAEFFKGLQNLKYDGPVMVEPFYAPLKTMAFEDAIKTAKAATDKVWPK